MKHFSKTALYNFAKAIQIGKRIDYLDDITTDPKILFWMGVNISLGIIMVLIKLGVIW